MTVNLMNVEGKMLKRPLSIKAEFDRVFGVKSFDVSNMTEQKKELLKKLLKRFCK